MNYPYKYCVITYEDDGYSEQSSTSFFCDFDDANEYYLAQVECCIPCLLYRLSKYANLNI